MPNVLSPRDLVSRPDNMDETVVSSSMVFVLLQCSSFFMCLKNTEVHRANLQITIKYLIFLDI